MTDGLTGTTVGIELDQDHHDRMHVTVRFTMSKELLERWRSRLGEDQDYEVSD